MPTYEYLCENCGERLEQFQSITAKPLKKCPNCGKLKLKRLISAGAGIIFKGSGFYETDYRSSSYKKGESAAKDASGGCNSSSSSSKADNKKDSQGACGCKSQSPAAKAPEKPGAKSS